jgi:hypothetical protein
VQSTKRGYKSKIKVIKEHFLEDPIYAHFVENDELKIPLPDH